MLRLLLRVCLGILSGLSSVQVFGQCAPPLSQVDLDINTVRARIVAGGDLWWDFTTCHYEIPKGSGSHSIFCGGIWMGGLDAAGNLHISAATYRQSGNDFWSGPLDTLNAITNQSTCDDYDRVWKLNKADVQSFVQNRNDPNYIIPQDILEWPGNGNTIIGHSKYLAPFTDVNGNGIYEPGSGDYPAFDLSGTNNCDYHLQGDQCLWWIFNDNGNVHGETGGTPFGMEFHAMAYAFRSEEEALDNATFYRYTIINRSTLDYHAIWFGQFSEYDLGDAFDDFSGCDVARGLGYCYNSDFIDGASAQATPGTYGDHPPAVGIDFLAGPYAAFDGVDNDRDSVTDEAGERFQMSNSIEEDWGPWWGNPQNAQDFYDRMQSIWNDGSHMTYGGSGYGGTVNANFMFPGTSDPYGWGTNGIPQPPWDEIIAGNLGSDRTALHSVGPFGMQPGQVEVVTIGVPWARDTSGSNLDAITALQAADDKLQAYFDNCFSLPCSAQALPEITFALNNSLAYFTLLGGGTSWVWDFGDGANSSAQHPSHYYSAPGTYTVVVSMVTSCGTFGDTTAVVVPDYLLPCGPELTRLEGQGNGKQELEFTSATIGEILNSPTRRSLFPIYTPMHGPVKVSYEDYHHLEDGDYRIAFDSIGFNSNWKMWRVGGTDTVYSDTSIDGGNVQRIAMWGLGVQMQQVKSPGYNNNPDRNGYLTSSISFSDPAKNWLTGFPDTEDHTKNNWIRSGWRTGSGVCVADYNDRYNGVNPIDRNEDYESILGGTWAPYRICAYNPYPNQTYICYEKGPAWWPSPVAATILNRFENISNVDIVITSDKTKWTRCCVVECGSADVLNQGQRQTFHLRDSPSVDKDGRNISSGGSSDPNDPNAADYIGANGMGWFPGYAINLETGERLNMAFAENSAYTQENGRDMLWNPTENEFAPQVGNLWGGCHYIYVFGHNGDATFTSPSPLAGELKDMPLYDAGKAMYTILASDNTSNPELREVYADAMWTTIPVINPGHAFMESDVTVKLRVQKPYAAYQTDSIPQNNNYPLYGFHIDKNNLECNAYMGDVTVFPNPFADQSVIHFENMHEHEAKVKLYDVQGKLVRELTTTSDRVVISSAGLFSGMYVWTLELEGEKARTGKIILR